MIPIINTLADICTQLPISISIIGINLMVVGGLYVFYKSRQFEKKYESWNKEDQL